MYNILSLQIQHILRQKFLSERSRGKVIQEEKKKGNKKLILQPYSLPLSGQRSAEARKSLNHIPQLPHNLYEVE